MDNMGKEDWERIIYEKMDNLKAADDDYRQLVCAIDEKIGAFIAKKKPEKSYCPGNNKLCKLKVVVPAVPITKNQLNVLQEYLEKKYLNKVDGDSIFIKKCFLGKKYKIFSEFDD